MAEKQALRGIRQFSIPSGIVNIGVLRGSGIGEKVPFMEAHLLVDALNSEKRANVQLIRPHVADAVLVSSPDGCRFLMGLGCIIFPTSEVVAYRAPGKSLGDDIIFASEGQQLAFPTRAFKGLVDACHSAAVIISNATSRNFQPKDGGISIVAVGSSELNAALLPDKTSFCTRRPSEYTFTGATVPQHIDHFAPTVSDAPDARYVMVSHSADTIAPLVRETGYYGERTKVVSFDCSPFEKYGVVVEIPPGDLHKFA